MDAMERRQFLRRRFSYYMCVMDEATGRLVGHFSDISTRGFMLDSIKPVPANENFRLRVEQTGVISNKSHITFTARTKWCSADIHDPMLYKVGFQITDITPGDYEVFTKMYSNYGVQGHPQQSSSSYSLHQN
jgi:hypothetical protein